MKKIIVCCALLFAAQPGQAGVGRLWTLLIGSGVATYAVVSYVLNQKNNDGMVVSRGMRPHHGMHQGGQNQNGGQRPGFFGQMMQKFGFQGGQQSGMGPQHGQHGPRPHGGMHPHGSNAQPVMEQPSSELEQIAEEEQVVAEEVVTETSPE